MRLDRRAIEDSLIERIDMGNLGCRERIRVEFRDEMTTGP